LSARCQFQKLNYNSLTYSYFQWLYYTVNKSVPCDRLYLIKGLDLGDSSEFKLTTDLLANNETLSRHVLNFTKDYNMSDEVVVML